MRAAIEIMAPWSARTPAATIGDDPDRTPTWSGVDPGPPPMTPRPVGGTIGRTMSTWHVPRLRRDGRLIGGVAAGIADEIGVDPLVTRIGFVVLALASGWGVVLYAATWRWLTVRERSRDPEPYDPEPKGATPTRRILGVTLVVLGLAVGLRSVAAGFDDRFVWPIGLLAVGALVAWHRGSPERGTRAMVARIVAGLVLVGVGTTLMVVLNVDLGRTGDAVLALSLVVAGIAVVVAPWTWRLVNELAEERTRRVRSEERARVAAHLHDSVLQTLALIQRNADDPGTTSQLARRQERELREWLYGEPSPAGPGRLREQLRSVATEVEELVGLPVEVVVVGDCTVGESERALLAAVREAVVNSAKHSGAGRVDVYAEVQDGRVEAFVRDTGRGFDPDAVPPDRRGVADSIVGRVTQLGGTATVHTRPGEGTEVELSVPRTSLDEEATA